MSDCSNSVTKYIVVEPSTSGTFSGLTICGGGGLTVDFVSGCTSDGVQIENTTFQGNTLTVPRINADVYSGSTTEAVYYGDGSNLSGIVWVPSFMTGGTYSGGSITFTGRGIYSDVVVDVSALLDDTNSYVTGGTWNNVDTLTIELNNGSNVPVTINSFGDLDVNGDLTVTGTTTVDQINGTTFSGGTFYGTFAGTLSNDAYVTGFTYNPNNLTLLRNQGLSDLVVGINEFSGLTINGDLTVTGDTTLSSVTADTLTVTSLNIGTGGTITDLIESLDTFVTGATLNGSSLEISRNQGLSTLTVDLSSLDDNDTYVSGGTYNTVTQGLDFTGTESSTTFSVPLFTSGNCITDLYVSNIHACSPLNINPLDEGNIYFGSTSGVTIDILNKSMGIGTTTPGDVVTGTKLQVETSGRTMVGLFGRSDAGSSSSTILFHDRISGSTSNFRVGQVDAKTTVSGGNFGSCLVFTVFEKANGTAHQALTLDNLGYAGINDTTPEARLSVYDPISNSVFKLESGDPRVNIRLVDSLTTNVAVIGASGNTITLGHVSGGDKLKIDDAGGVNIVTTPTTDNNLETFLMRDSNGLIKSRSLGSITGITSSDTYVTGSTLNGNILELGRNEGLPTLSVDLSPLDTGGSLLQNTYFVSSLSGNNTTAIVGDVHKPWKTITEARNSIISANTSDTLIHVYPGEYVEDEIQYENGNFYFEPGSVIRPPVRAGFTPVFNLGSTLTLQPNTYTATTCNIYGNVDIELPASSNGIGIWCRGDSESVFEFNRITLGDGYGVIAHNTSKIIVKGNEIYGDGGQYSLSFRHGSESYVDVKRIVGPSGYTYSNAIFWKDFTGVSYVKSHEITGPDDNIVLFTQNVSTGSDIVVDSDVIRHTNSGTTYVINNYLQTGGKYTINCDNIYSNGLGGGVYDNQNSGGELIVNGNIKTDSTSITSTNTNSTNHTFRYNGNIQTTNPTSAIDLDGGTIILGGSLDGLGVTTNGINVASGVDLSISNFIIENVSGDSVTGTGSIDILNSLYVDKPLSVPTTGQYIFTGTTYDADLNIYNTPTSNNTLTSILVRDSDGDIKTRSLASITGLTSSDIFVSAVSYDGSANKLTVTRNDATTFDTYFNTFSGLTINGDVVIDGNVTVRSVSATTVDIQSEHVLIADNFITLNSNVTGGTPTENAGIEISRGDETKSVVLWNETLDRWEIGVSGNTSEIITESSLSSFDSFVTGATLNGSSLEISRNQGLSTLSVDLSSLDDNDTYVTGATWNSSNNTITVSRNEGESNLTMSLNEFGSDVTFESNLNVNGDISVTGTTNLIGLTTVDQINGTTFSGGTFYGTFAGTLSNDAYVTGATLNGSSLELGRNQGLTTLSVDLSTLDDNDTYVSGGTISGIDSNSNTGTIDLTYVNDEGTPYSLNFQDTYVTGGTYDNSTVDITLTRNDGTKVVVDLSSMDTNDTFVSGVTWDSVNTLTTSLNDGSSILTTIDTFGDLTVTGTTNLEGDVNITGTTQFRGNIANTGDSIITQNSIIPNADRNLNLGSSSKAWSRVYTQYLALEDDSGDDRIDIKAPDQTVPGTVAWVWELPPSTGVTGSFLGSYNTNGDQVNSSWFELVAGTNITLDTSYALSGSSITVNASNDTNSYVTGGTVSGTDLVLGRNGGLVDVTIDTSDYFDNTDNYVTGATMNVNTLELSRSGGLSDVTVDLSQFVDDTNDGVVSGATMNGNTLELGRTQGLSDVTVDLSQFIDDTNYYVTGSTLNGNTLELGRNGGLSTLTTDLSTLNPDTNLDRKLFIPASMSSDMGSSTIVYHGVTGVGLLSFGGAVTDNEQGSFPMLIPQDYVSGGTIELIYTTQTTANDVVWSFAITNCSDGEDFATITESGAHLDLVSVGQTFLNRGTTSTITPTGTTFNINDAVTIRVNRDASDSRDTANNITAYIYGLIFNYKANN